MVNPAAQPGTKSAQLPSTAAAAEPKKRAAAFEIDDIFGAKKVKPSSNSVPGPADATNRNTVIQIPSAVDKKGKKSKKGDQQPGTESAQAIDKHKDDKKHESSRKRVPETVIDTSATITAYQPPPPPSHKRTGAAADGQQDEEEKRFMDSRGTREPTNRIILHFMRGRNMC